MINEKDIIKAPSDIMMFTWLYKLMSEEHCSFNETNNNIIDLDSYASSWFIVGRDNENLNGFIGVSNSFIPWFLQVDFKQAVVNFEKGRLFLSCGTEEEEGLTISIKIRDKRLALLWHENFSDDAVKSLDFRIFGVKADNSITLSEVPVKNIPLIKSNDLLKVVKTTQKKVSGEEIYAEDIKNRYENMFKNKYANNDLDEDIEE